MLYNCTMGSAGTDNTAIFLLRLDSFFPCCIALGTYKDDRLYILPNGSHKIPLSLEDRLSSSQLLHNLFTLQRTREILSIASCGATEIQIIHQKNFSKSYRYKRIITEDVISLSHKGSCEIFHNSAINAMFGGAILFSSVHL